MLKRYLNSVKNIEYYKEFTEDIESRSTKTGSTIISYVLLADYLVKSYNFMMRIIRNGG